ncbi:hypothetical protein KEM60_01523 [Austwickia sp. TVS 96-490-7B]|uniref:DUF4118 domain-containing protein n=1 Tax=Austwickia sp. TVS 96-490-7B TaxID=2830843 RepID=UPI001C5A5669|nr:DUF4118 domain-containing protein [Austwickia sp. TVS 96-490-7B]MBW3085326.1 hypothetical protein [Austwickia sp. TVS 96-490-7B]
MTIDAVLKTWWARDEVRRVAAVVVPALAAVAVWPWRESVDSAVNVLLLTLVVVAFAASGDRISGVVSAVSAAAWFDYFLVPPYLTFRIGKGEDIALTALFVVVGMAVTELALRGRRQAESAARRLGYVDGVLGVLRVDPQGTTGADRSAAICQEIQRILSVDSCVYVAGAPAGGWPVVTDSGVVMHDSAIVEVEVSGLPTTSVVAIPVRRGEEVLGHFRLVAASKVVRATADQLKVAVLLADQVAVA